MITDQPVKAQPMQNKSLNGFTKNNDHMDLVDRYNSNLIELYIKEKKELNQKCSDVRVEYTSKYNMDGFKKMWKSAKKSRSKAFHISEILNVGETLNLNDKPLSYSFAISMMPEEKSELKINDQTGIFKLVFSDGSFMFFYKWVGGLAKERSVESLYAAEDEVWMKFLTMMNKDANSKKRPPIGGIYRFGNGIYNKIEKIKETPVVHESVNIVLEDINMFDNNLSMFTRFNMPGTRKVMLVGPPGTGKSSLGMRIASKYQKEKNVTFFTEIAGLALHLNLCAKYGVPTICFLEDAEGTLQKADSSLLNLLDGIDQPINLKGAYVIMTTNHPHKIERRILQRPGRIDAIFPFGNLKGEYAIKCAEIYFKDLLFGPEKVIDVSDKKIIAKLSEILDVDGNGVTGTRVKQYSEDVVKYMVSKKKTKITLDELSQIFKITENTLKTVYDMAKEQGLLDGEPIGFHMGESQQKGPSFNEKDTI